MSSSLLEDTVTELLLVRGPEKTICPSEVARLLYPENWREHMEEVRAVALKMALEEIIEISQRGRVKTPPFEGPIRLRFKKIRDAGEHR